MSGRERLIDSYVNHPPQPRTWVAVSLSARVRGWVERRLNRTRIDRFGFDGRRDR